MKTTQVLSNQKVLWTRHCLLSNPVPCLTLNPPLIRFLLPIEKLTTTKRNNLTLKTKKKKTKNHPWNKLGPRKRNAAAKPIRTKKKKKRKSTTTVYRRLANSVCRTTRVKFVCFTSVSPR
uniref:Uncharacterized protein n=1 Tax=Cacopsylla melanoneura TaxID=428564 RepID=A0A8D8QFN3_9HEMI